MSTSASKKTGRRRLLSALAAALLVAAPTIFFQLPNVLPEIGWLFIVIGIIAVLGVAARAVILDLRKAADEREVSRYRTAVKRAFAPLASHLAGMIPMGTERRRAELFRVSDRVAGSLGRYLLGEIPDLRVNVFWINKEADQLWAVSHDGAGEMAGPFVGGPGNTAANENLNWVLAGGAPRREGNYSSTPNRNKAARYESYVSVVIQADQDAYGMITIDSSAIDAFTDTDEETVVTAARLLAVAFGLAYPGTARATAPATSPRGTIGP